METATNGENLGQGVAASQWDELKVEGEPGVWFCARHKNIKVRLRCGRCEKPICPKCTVMAPTGARCRDCASNRDSHMYQVAPVHYLMSFGAALVMGAIGAVLLDALGIFWLWILLYAPALGPVLGRAVVKITRGKRGPKVATVVSLGLVVGAAGAALLTGGIAIANPILWLFVAIAIAGVWAWLK